MDLFASFSEGLVLALNLNTFMMVAIGLFFGMLVGSLPGFTTVMAMAILLPFSFFMEPLIGIPFLIGIYKGGIYGGSIPAILISMPGTGAAVATTFDGPALTKKGQGRKALEMGLTASVFGDFISDIVTIIMIAPIAYIALQFGPPELMGVLILSLIVIAATTTGLFIKSVLMLFIGIGVAMIGIAPVGLITRFTFGWFPLTGGIPLLPMLIGLFAIPEIFLAVEKRAASYVRETVNLKGTEKLTFEDIKKCFRTLCRSTFIGTWIGMVPGVGQVVAAFMGYAAAKNASPHPETFGRGEIEGVAAAEAANNAVNGPTLVPMLTLGIPGDNVTAILLGAFMIQGLRPGPELMTTDGALIYAILIAMLIANVLFIAIGWLAIPLFARLVTVRKSILLSMTIIFAMAGSLVFRNQPLDILFLVVFGIFGYIARKLRFDVAPMAMAFILAKPLEEAFSQTQAMSGGNIISFIVTERWIALAFLIACPLVAYYLWRRSVNLQRRMAAEQ
jgi:putative tricarboxylic transport membrane protein